MPSVYLYLENSFELNLQPTPTFKILKRRLAKEKKTGKKPPKKSIYRCILNSKNMQEEIS